jgi:transposase
MKQAKYTIQSFNKQFPDNEACLKYLFDSLHKDAVCPSCKQSGKYHLQANTSHFVCSCGGHQISPKQGTIFEKSSTDLYKWFFAMYLFSTAKNGVSAKELERQLGVTYKCAWRMAYQIRQLMEQMPDIFDGTVEADETYIGGKRRGKRGRGAEGKTPVVGVHKRGGGVYAKATPNTKASTVMAVVRENVQVGATLMTDEYRSYGKASKMGYKHETVNHGRKEYVKGNAHTNTIEGFWSQLKRSIDGTHHSISPKHLQKYLDEHVWRWNLRTSSEHLFHLLLQEV